MESTVAPKQMMDNGELDVVWFLRVNIGGETSHNNDNTCLSGERVITILNVQVILSIKAHLCCDGH